MIMMSALVAMLLLTAPSITPTAQAEEITATSTMMATTTVPVESTTTVSPSIEALMAQLQKLTELFNSLKAQLLGVTAEMKDLKAGLREGMTDADIAAIQEALASDPTIYPAGLKTGYFGPMTKEAVKKFQTKNGLEVTGEINAETKAALEVIMDQRKAEGKFPLGLLLAPGAQLKFEDRLRTTCGRATTTTAGSDSLCTRLKEKYKLEVDEKGRLKMEVEQESEREDSDDSHDEMDDEDDDRDEDEERESEDEDEEDEDDDERSNN